MPSPNETRGHAAPRISFKAACASLSQVRLSAYSLTTDHDSGDAAARYLWNMALATALQSVLHVAEVAFRNALFSAGEQTTALRKLSFGRVPCWLDASPSILQPNEVRDVGQIVQNLARNRQRCTPGHLVSRLGFGFWVRLCHAPYEQGNFSGPQLWPRAASLRFAYAPKESKTRSAIRDLADRVRETRNLVAHHQPIWDRDPVSMADAAIQLLAWMNPRLGDAVRAASRVPHIYRAGPARYRALADDTIGPYA